MLKNILRKEGGFTLIELLVVIVVLGLLIAVAVPTFKSVRDSAKVNDAKNDVKIAHTAARANLAVNDQYGAGTLAAMQAAEPGVTMAASDVTVGGSPAVVTWGSTPAATPSPGTVYVNAATGTQNITIAAATGVSGTPAVALADAGGTVVKVGF